LTIWTWGKITALQNQISQTLSGSTNIGNMVSGGGIASAFDGVISQSSAACANLLLSQNYNPGLTTVSMDAYVGKNYSGASPQQIGFATVYPATDLGFFNIVGPSNAVVGIPNTVTFNLRAKQTAPSGPQDGAILATQQLSLNQLAAVTLTSSDQV